MKIITLITSLIFPKMENMLSMFPLFNPTKMSPMQNTLFSIRAVALTFLSINKMVEEHGSIWALFIFEKAKNSNTGLVKLNLKSDSGGMIVADAVKFGGGMGNIARKPDDEPFTKSVVTEKRSG